MDFKKVSINPLVFIMFFAAHIFGILEEFFVIFIMITLHEIFHILAAIYYKIKINKVNITPIGLTAELSFTKSIELKKEIYIYLCGPLFNLLMIITGCILNLYFENYSNTISFFVLSNISLLLINLVPILPLDGGRILKATLHNKIGFYKTYKVLNISSKIFVLLLAIIGVLQTLYSHYNFSILIICILLLFLFDREKKNMQLDLMKDIIIKKQLMIKSGTIKLEYLACNKNAKAINAMKSFKKARYHILKIFDDNLNIIGEITETELFEGIIHKGTNPNLDEFIKE